MPPQFYLQQVLPTLYPIRYSHYTFTSDALEAIKDKSVIPQLRKSLDSDDVWTRIYVKLTIKKLEVIGLSDGERLKFLKDSLKDEQFETRQWAAIELAKIGTEEAIGILKQAVEDKTNPGSYSADKVLMKLTEQGKISKK